GIVFPHPDLRVARLVPNAWDSALSYDEIGQARNASVSRPGSDCGRLTVNMQQDSSIYKSQGRFLGGFSCRRKPRPLMCAGVESRTAAWTRLAVQLLLQGADELHHRVDLVLGQFAIVSGHLVFALGYDTGQIGVGLALHIG